MLVSLLLASLSLSLAAGAPTADVTLANGTVTGTGETVAGRQVWQFLGIPFAQPPVGALRLRRARPLEQRWAEPLSATTPPPGCLQHPMPLPTWPEHLRPRYAEDCLYLSVWTPALSGRPRAVIVWVHGGGFFVGEGWPMYNGKALAAIEDVVVVVIQYRLSFLGFARLDDRVVPGNLGLLDQQLAIRWVHENVAHFGGDPDAITLVGESAGSGSVSLHMLSEETTRYVARGVMVSGTASAMWACDRNTAAIERAYRRDAAEYLGCDQEDVDALVACLQAKSEAELTRAMTTMNIRRELTNNVHPTLDGEFMAECPAERLAAGRVPHRDVIIGVAEEEGSVVVKTLAVKFMALMGMEGKPRDDLYLNDSFIDWFVHQTVPFYPSFPHPTSPLIARYLRTLAVSHVDPTRGDLFAKRMSNVVGEVMFECPSNAFADAVRAVHDRVFFYEWAHKPSHPNYVPLFPIESSPWMDATHGDLPLFLFGFHLLYPHLEGSMTAEEEALSRRVMADFAAFARTGRPHDPKWLPFSLKKQEFFRYGLVSSLRTGGRKRNECAFWTQVLPLLHGASCRKDARGECAMAFADPPGAADRRRDEL